MKKIILLLCFVFICQNQLAAQIIIGPVETHNVAFTRHDDYSPGDIAYANTTLTLEVKTGVTSPQFNSFPANNFTPKNYAFPSLTSASQVTYVRVTFNDLVYPNPSLFSGYYPLSTVVGSHTTISDPNLVVYDPYPGRYGYGVDIYCVSPNQYTIRVTKFLCYICVRPPVSKMAGPQKDIALVPNPSMGESELYYTAEGRETLSVNVTDINGKIIKIYTKDVEAGLNKIPIDIQNHLSGSYLVQWKSSTGKSGSLKLMKK
ncbi:hypothetical protein CEY12_04310 [Chryseobacterium sp. T16E-39]|uniref:T9SS type A sorting domain-containing protein n=1 Tax=Chryseobacterium sp. T16E-39 TaxID=2015076 RepID=UPI000B5B1B7E|nr:T9SS type A sorting domain-containing protein [Chryseobacterium sp. T16E-39]ASK29368.1 hypothetical protein CEY12_04310 [Chryseobacterium sp. T16E-39]